MTRGALIILGLILIAIGVIATVVRMHADGISTLAIAGLAIVAITHRWVHGPTSP